MHDTSELTSADALSSTYRHVHSLHSYLYRPNPTNVPKQKDREQYHAQYTLPASGLSLSCLPTPPPYPPALQPPTSVQVWNKFTLPCLRSVHDILGGHPPTKGSMATTFADTRVENFNFESTWRKVRKSKSNETQTEQREYEEEAVQTVVSLFQTTETSDNEAQTQHFTPSIEMAFKIGDQWIYGDPKKVLQPPAPVDRNDSNEDSIQEDMPVIDQEMLDFLDKVLSVPPSQAPSCLCCVPCIGKSQGPMWSGHLVPSHPVMSHTVSVRSIQNHSC